MNTLNLEEYSSGFLNTTNGGKASSKSWADKLANGAQGMASFTCWIRATSLTCIERRVETTYEWVEFGMEWRRAIGGLLVVF